MRDEVAPAFRLVGPQGSAHKRENKNIKINLDSYKERSMKFILPMPSITSGKYNIFWRALSPDGHIIKGKSEFEVK